MQLVPTSEGLRRDFPVSYKLMKLVMFFFFAGIFGVLLVALSTSIDSKFLQILGTFLVGASVVLGVLTLICEIPVGIYEAVKRSRNPPG